MYHDTDTTVYHDTYHCSLQQIHIGAKSEADRIVSIKDKLRPKTIKPYAEPVGKGFKARS